MGGPNQLINQVKPFTFNRPNILNYIIKNYNLNLIIIIIIIKK
jgi:hypothetical protein